MFEKEPFGALERLVTQKPLDVVKRVTKEELDDENWLAWWPGSPIEAASRCESIVLQFLEAHIFNLSVENCVTFLDPLIESWDIDLTTFGMEIVLTAAWRPDHPKRFEFVEREPVPPADEQPGFLAFLQDPSLRGDATAEEIEFLRNLQFARKRPTSLYY